MLTRIRHLYYKCLSSNINQELCGQEIIGVQLCLMGKKEDGWAVGK